VTVHSITLACSAALIPLEVMPSPFKIFLKSWLIRVLLRAIRAGASCWRLEEAISDAVGSSRVCARWVWVEEVGSADGGVLPRNLETGRHYGAFVVVASSPTKGAVNAKGRTDEDKARDLGVVFVPVLVDVGRSCQLSRLEFGRKWEKDAAQRTGGQSFNVKAATCSALHTSCSSTLMSDKCCG
jgi:hypothetical protein